jgi:hypothetical protein
MPSKQHRLPCEGRLDDRDAFRGHHPEADHHHVLGDEDARSSRDVRWQLHDTALQRLELGRRPLDRDRHDADARELALEIRLPRGRVRAEGTATQPL